jgi:hypothetical protein
MKKNETGGVVWGEGRGIQGFSKETVAKETT